jgi:phenylalanyl-tRNA synthetase beta chain
VNIQILHSWLTEYLETDASAPVIGEKLALCGPSVEKVEKHGKDWLYDIEITTNRVDMMSVYGIAREAAAILPQFGYKTKLKPLTLNREKLLKKDAEKTFPLAIKTKKELTNRVMAVIMDNVEIGESPAWIKQRLEAAGIRSLNTVIDVTNYVMTEIGHPTHVFDYDRIKSHSLQFRLSKKGEKVTTLDEKTYVLPGNDSVIEDSSGTIIDLPGIMGTANSVVTKKTKRIIFFIDNNDPILMRNTSMTLGIRTVAATLNEKQVDPELGEAALLRGIELYRMICKAKVASKLYDIYLKKPPIRLIKVSLDFISERLGKKVNESYVRDILTSLGFKVTSHNKSHPLTVKVPSWRNHDVQIPEDIVEEVARIYGYFKLPSLLPTGEFPKSSPQTDQFYWEDIAKTALKYWGYTENYTYSLISEELIEKIGKDTKNYLELRNPLTLEWRFLRQSLIPSLLQSLTNNQDKRERLQLFEMANIYLPQKEELPQEIMHLALVRLGKQYLQLKGDIEGLASELGVRINFKPVVSNPILDTQIQAEIFVNKKKIGYIGQLSHQIQKAFNLKEAVVVAQLNFENLSSLASKNKIYVPIPKYPPIIEDMTFFNEARIPAANILQAVTSIDPIVRRVEIIGVFENKISLRITYQSPKKNLATEDILPLRQQIVVSLEKLGLILQSNSQP